MKAKPRNWKKTFEDFASSSQSGTKFCRVNGIPLSNFYKMKKRLLVSSEKQKPVTVQMNPVPPKDPVEIVDLTEQFTSSSQSKDQATLRITSPSGFTLEVFL